MAVIGGGGGGWWRWSKWSPRSARRPRRSRCGLPALVAVRTAGTWRCRLCRHGGPGPPALASQPRPATCIVRQLGHHPGTVAQDARDACTTRHGRRQARPLARRAGSRRLHPPPRPHSQARIAPRPPAQPANGGAKPGPWQTAHAPHAWDAMVRIAGAKWRVMHGPRAPQAPGALQRVLALPQVPTVRAPGRRAARSDPRRQPAPRARRRAAPPTPAPAARTERVPARRAGCPARTRSRPSPSPAARPRCPEA